MPAPASGAAAGSWPGRGRRRGGRVNPVDAGNRAYPSWAGVDPPYVVGYELARRIQAVGDWLVATHRTNASWVHNLRAAGDGTLTRGRRRYTFTAVELAQPQAAIVLKEVLGPRLAKPVGGFVLRQKHECAAGR